MSKPWKALIPYLFISALLHSAVIFAELLPALMQQLHPLGITISPSKKHLQAQQWAEGEARTPAPFLEIVLLPRETLKKKATPKKKPPHAVPAPKLIAPERTPLPPSVAHLPPFSAQAELETDEHKALPTFPAHVEIDYVVMGLMAAKHFWRSQGKYYQIRTEAHFGQRNYQLSSHGEITAQGLRPYQFVEQRNQREYYRIDFDWPTQRVHYGAVGKQQDAALHPGAQDIFSAAYQFALRGNALENFTMQVVTVRNSYQVPFILEGETVLQLGPEAVSALVLSGHHGRRYFKFFLAPQWHNIPIRVLFDDGVRTVDLLATDVRINGQAVLTAPDYLNSQDK